MAYDQAHAFKETVDIGSVVITKLDGHAKVFFFCGMRGHRVVVPCLQLPRLVLPLSSSVPVNCLKISSPSMLVPS